MKKMISILEIDRHYDEIIFHRYAEQFIYDHDIVFVPANLSDPKTSETVIAAFKQAGVVFDVLDYENRIEDEKEYDCSDDELTPLFERNPIKTPFVVIGHRYVFSANEIIDILNAQERKGHLIVYNVDWMLLSKVHKFYDELDTKCGSTSFKFIEPDFEPYHMDYDDLGLDEDEWSSSNRIDNDEFVKQDQSTIKKYGLHISMIQNATMSIKDVIDDVYLKEKERKERQQRESDEVLEKIRKELLEQESEHIPTSASDEFELPF